MKDLAMEGSLDKKQYLDIVDGYIARTKAEYIKKLVPSLGGMSDSEIRLLKWRADVENDRLIRDIAMEIIGKRGRP